MQRLAVHYELREGTRDHSAVKKIIRCYKNGFSNLYSFPRACICPQTDGSNGPRDKSNSRVCYYCQSNLRGRYYGHSTSNLTKITSFRVTMAKVTSERPMSGNRLTPDKARPLLEKNHKGTVRVCSTATGPNEYKQQEGDRTYARVLSAFPNRPVA